MNPDYEIYELSEVERNALKGGLTDGTIDEEKLAEIREDVARLSGYLKGRSETHLARGKDSNSDLTG